MAMSESTFNGYLAKILSARYGEEVRGSIHDSLQGMYEIVKGNVLDVTTAKQTIDTAAAAANSAASKANTAASNADTATSKANASATKADTAAAGANTAKDAANTAASKATTEAGKATTGATQANAAASSANSAASAATEAASKVDAAIEKAETATSSANKAAESANTAKSEADKATTRANDAAAIIESLEIGDINVGEIATKRYVDAIEIGGRNLLRETNQGTKNWYWALGTGSATLTEFVENTTRCVKMTRDNVESTSYSTIQYKFPYSNIMIPDRDYILSFWVKPSVTTRFSCRISRGNGRNALTNVVDAEPATIPANIWTHCVAKFHSVSKWEEDQDSVWNDECIYLSTMNSNTGVSYSFRDIGLWLGNKAPTDWSPAPEDVQLTSSRRAAVTYDYGGRNLKEVFGTPKALHDALAAEDYSQIAVGDYWPITLNGTFWDYGAYTVQSGKKYYSDNGLEAEAGTTEVIYEGTYVSDKAVSFLLSGSTYYAAIGDCLPHFERTCDNVAFKLEVAGINSYWRYGDKGDLTGNKPHIVFISRDCFPFWMRMRKSNDKWENIAARNPWVGSAMYKTLNDEEHGALKLVTATDIGTYIYAGPNGFGMRALMQLKKPNEANANSWEWNDRGKLFLPTVSEVFGAPFFANPNYDGGVSNQLAIFRDSRRHISKSNRDGGGTVAWWFSSSSIDDSTKFVFVRNTGNVDSQLASSTYTVPICFVFV